MTRMLTALGIVILAAVSIGGALSGTGADAAAVDPAQPPQRLADTGLYAPGQPGTIDPRNRAFAPQYPLWSDGLTKRRWIYIPPGGAINATDLHDWIFPVGTRLWKEFSVGDQRIETRLLWKASAAGWIAASYVWNDDSPDARLAPDAGLRDVLEIAPGRRHSIPSRSDCAACHGPQGRPLGFNLLQLSDDRDPGAIHGEPLTPGMLTLARLMDEGLLTPRRAELIADPPRIRASSAATRSALGYLAANCGMCHNGAGVISAPAPVISYRDLLDDGDAVARSLLDHPTRWQVPGSPDGTSVLVHPGAPESSALFLRMRSRAPSSQMPPLGTVVRDQEAVDALGAWISGTLVHVQ